jgi:hypothetical protein
MSAQHTPGPWACLHYDAHSEVVTHTPIFSSVCDVHTTADAELIAAAPDLLAALEMALIWLDYEGKYDVQGIRAAIAKARGQQ